MAPKKPTVPNKKLKVDLSKKRSLTVGKNSLPPKQTHKGGRTVASKSKQSNAANSKEAPAAKTGWPSAEDMKKLARFDWLLRQFINSANALEDEFGGIPEEIDIIADKFGRYHGSFTTLLYCV